MKLSTSIALAGLLGGLPLLSAAADLDGRVTRIENILDSQRGSDLLLQVQGLEREVQRLRGQVEEQKYELDRLKRQQRDQYKDLDGRLGGAQAAAEPAPGSSPSSSAPSPVSGSAAEAAPAEGAAPATAAGGGVESPAPPISSFTAPAGRETAVEPTPATPPVAERPGADGEQVAYIKAVAPLKERRFEDAARTLADFLAQYPQGKYADTAHFWLAETHYVNRDSAAALAEFQLILKEFPKSTKVPGALLKIGYIQADAKDTTAARATLEEVIRRFPQSGEARLAQARLDQMK